MPSYLVKGSWTMTLDAWRVIEAPTPEEAVEAAKGPGIIDTAGGTFSYHEKSPDHPVWNDAELLFPCGACKSPTNHTYDASTPEGCALRVCGDCFSRFCDDNDIYHDPFEGI